MFCPKCGNQLPDGAAFCGKCGAKLAQPKTSVPASRPGTGSSAADAAAAVGAKPRSIVPIAIIGVIAIVLVVVLVRMFACSSSGGGPSILPSSSNVNLIELAEADDSAVTQMLSKYATNNELNDYLGYAVYSNSKDMLNKAADSVKSGKGFNGGFDYKDGDWTLVFKNGYFSGGMSESEIAKSNERSCHYAMRRSADSLSAKELGDIASKVFPYDRCLLTVSSDTYADGYCKGNGYIAAVVAEKQKEGGWSVSIDELSLDSTEGSLASKSFESSYSNYDASRDIDSYKK